MEWYNILLIIVGVLVFLFGLYLLLGGIFIHVFLSKISIHKIFKKNAALPNNPFYQQVDLEWFNDEKIFQIVSIPSFDHHVISAHVAMNREPSHQYIIYVHGWCGSPDEETKLLRDIHEKLDYNIICIEQRAQWDSHIKLCTMGIRESRDLLDWINYVIKQDDQAHIVLYGMSMGAATVSMVNKYSLPSQVKCLIADAGYSSIYETFLDSSYANFKSWFSHLLISSAYVDLEIFHHLDIKKESPLKALSHCQIPCLFIQGDQDQMVPLACLARNAAAVKKGIDVKTEVFKGVLHGLCAVADYNRYYQITTDFIKRQNK
ncbi:MAG: alpha/beta fold hydrolase [Bacilli bacterium]